MPRSRVKAAIFVFSMVFFLSTSIAHGGEILTIDNKTLTLGECIAIGLKMNPTGEISQQALKAIQEKVGEAKAGYYPAVKISSAYTYTAPTERMAAGASDSYDNRLAIRQTLFDAGATSNLIQGVFHNITALEYDTTKTKLDIGFTVSTLFIDVLKKQELLAVAKATLTSTEQHRQQSQALYKEGLTPRADVIKSEVQVSSARLSVVSADTAVLTAKAALSAFMGVPVTIVFDVDGREVARMQHLPLPPDVREALDQAYHSRPELMGVKARLAAADAAISQAVSGFYPNVSLDASYGWQEDTFAPTDTKWGVGVTVSLPVFEQLTTRSKVGQAVANRNGVKASETQALRAVELEVQQAWLSLNEAHERQTVAAKALEQASEDMRVSEGRYQEGVGTILEVIDAQTALTQAKTNQVVAAFDIATAQVKLDRATGQRPTEEIGK